MVHETGLNENHIPEQCLHSMPQNFAFRFLHEMCSLLQMLHTKQLASSIPLLLYRVSDLNPLLELQEFIEFVFTLLPGIVWMPS